MNVTQIVLHDFRNILEETVSFTPGVNILYGKNAQGKTNVLEGIYCFACGKSFRGNRDRELIRFGCGQSRLELSFRDINREQKMELSLFEEKSREMKRNGVPIRKRSEFVGTFHAVLFCPEHLSMIQGPPGQRRQFLDSAICQLKPSYLAALSLYGNVLKQRNALLRDEDRTEEERLPLLEVLTQQMAEYNTRIVITRSRYLRLLEQAVSSFLSEMTSDRERLSLTYCSDEQIELEDHPEQMKDSYFRKCMSYAKREMAAGISLHGCHRDDIGILLNGKEAKLFGSQGQDRSIALAMKLGEGEISRAAMGEYPVFLFDDVLSELDCDRQRYLLQKLEERQVILTSCNRELFEGMHAPMIRVEEGTYEREEQG